MTQSILRTPVSNSFLQNFPVFKGAFFQNVKSFKHVFLLVVLYKPVLPVHGKVLHCKYHRLFNFIVNTTDISTLL